MPQNWIHKLNESNSKNYKLDVIAQALAAHKLGAKDASDFLTLAWYAYNPYMTYNIKKVPTTEGLKREANSISSFVSLIQRLDAREVTGHAAIAEVERASRNYDSDLWNNLLRPVILKDLRVGATLNSFNKILKGTSGEIPVFESQLATDSEKHLKKLVGKKLIEPKLDGIRALAIVDREFPNRLNVDFFSRNGKALKNFPHIAQQLAHCLQLNATGGVWQGNRHSKFVIDGEIVSENFQALMKQARRKTNIDTSDSVFTIFDVIPLDHFNKGKWNVPQRTRTDVWLGELRDKVNASCTSLHVIEGFEVDLDTAEGHDQMRRYAEDQIELGYEGIMIKDVDAPYVCKRRTAWMKWKPTITVDLMIVGIEEGTGRNVGKLGAFVCEGDDDGKTIKVNCGGGFKDAQRTEFWDNRDDLVGHLVEVKADAVTQNENGTYSLRFPRFVRFRDIEAGEKI